MADETLSLHDELEKALNSAEEDEAGIQSDESDSTDQKPDKAESHGGEVDDKQQKQEALGDGENGDETPDDNGSERQENNQRGDLSAPEHWSATDKETFAKSPRDVQEWALRRDKEMTADYTRKTQDIANFRKTWEPLNDMFAPHIAQGVNPTSLIQSWAQVANQLQQNPQQAIQQLAQQYNVDLNSFTKQKENDIWGEETQPQNYQDPRFSQLEQQFNQLTGQLQQRDQAEREAKVKTFEDNIRSFAEQKTEAGSLAHPHFDELLPDMMNLAKVTQQNGQQPDLQKLYETALWANPSTREKTIAAQQAAAAKKAEDEAIAKARKARQASKSVGGNSTSASLQHDMSLRDMLESQF